MANPNVGRILPGMNVCDITGGKVGSIAKVHHLSQPSDPAGGSGPDEILEVKTGLFGLGKHLYIPTSAVQEVLAESIFISEPKERFESLGYHQKPADLS